MTNNKLRNQDILYLFQEIARALKQRSHGKTGSLAELTHVQLHALFALKRHGPMSMTELAEELHISAPTATALADRLVESAWITRAYNQSDRRIVRLALTAKTRRTFEEILKKKLHHLAKILSYLNDEDLDHLLRILQTIDTKLKEGNASHCTK